MATICLFTGIVSIFGAEVGASFIEFNQPKLSFTSNTVTKRNWLSLVGALKPLGDGRGFGSPSSSSSFSSKAKSRRNNKNGNENRNVQFIDTKTPSDRNTTASHVLDKWGFPPPTVEDIFPLLSKESELIPINPGETYNIHDVQKYLRDYFPNNLNWKYISLRDSKSASIHRDDFDRNPSMFIRMAHVSPPILVIDNFLTEQECLDVKRVVLSDTGKEIRNNENAVRVQSKTLSQYALSKRTSTSWFCYYKSVPTVLSKFQQVLGISDLSQCEEPQIVQYQSGQEFSWHYDEIPIPLLSNGGQRLATILIYLNTVPLENGGSTTFRDLSNGEIDAATPLSIQPKLGSAVIFFPSNIHGRPDERTLHRSTPIVGDSVSKWILQIWIHERSYLAVVPEGNRIEDAYADIDAASRRLGYINE
jgi:prolyl 4-hydroxylase